jgi:hypothetical protein
VADGPPGVCVGSGVGVRVGVFVGAFVGVFVGVRVGVLVGVLEGMGVADGPPGVCVGNGVGVLEGVLVGVLVDVFVGVFVGVLVGVFVGVLVGVGVLTAPPQKPPSNVYWPPGPVPASAPASGRPTAAPSEYEPAVLKVPPPPTIAFQDRSKPPPTWAYPTLAASASRAVDSSNPIRPDSLDLFIPFSFAALSCSVIR